MKILTPTLGCCRPRSAGMRSRLRHGQTELSGRDVIVVCQQGLKISQGVAAWLRHEGIKAETLEGGFDAWRAAGGLLTTTGQIAAAR
jgi:rhodanese-related sulfurtransferase